MRYQPIKFTWEQYIRLKNLIRSEFGNVSLAKGLYIITYLYVKYLPKSIRNFYRRKYYTPFNNKKRGLYKRWK
jgi:hypothetical protein